MFGDLAKQEDNDLPFLIPSIVQPNYQKHDFIYEKKVGVRGRPKGQKNNIRKKQLEKPKDGTSSNRSIGHWSTEENRKYHWFLEIYNNHFLNKHLRRTDKIFKTMEIFLGSREAEQCRSHHQKMEKKHKSFQAILLHLRNQYYGTEDHAPIAEDLLNNNMQLIDSLVKAEHLHRDPQLDKQDQNFNNDLNLQLHQESKAIENIFSDKYEVNMDIRFL